MGNGNYGMAIVMALILPGWGLAQVQPVRTEIVRFRSGTETVSGYLATPRAAGRHPALVVIHEWWGLVPWVKEQAEKFAAAGYVALAVDLYRGQTATTPELAHELSRGLPPDRALRDLQAAVDYLAGRPDVDPQHIGAVGWCMGGGLALQLAVHEPRLAACIVNYGALVTDPAAIASIRCPVLGNFGAEDRGIPPSAVQAFEKAMQAAGKQVDIKIYPGAGHAFENPNNKQGYRPEAAADAWKRMLDFLHRTLQQPARWE